ncbi:hypothetical protein RUM43_006395 [Polyplax serrata]|uniref:Uncharacterized protein n=1 Tax=Polyplax serrata TaxID=468196 RepID=A0AAN8PYN6_POLSC
MKYLIVGEGILLSGGNATESERQKVQVERKTWHQSRERKKGFSVTAQAKMRERERERERKGRERERNGSPGGRDHKRLLRKAQQVPHGRGDRHRERHARTHTERNREEK